MRNVPVSPHGEVLAAYADKHKVRPTRSPPDKDLPMDVPEKDRKILCEAMAAKADILVTDDKDFRAKGRNCKNIKVLNSKEYSEGKY